MKNKGFSLLEALLGLAGVAIVSYIINSLFVNTDKLILEQDKEELLVKILEENTFEIQSKNIDLLPNENQCLVRFYKLQDTSEFTSTLSNNPCSSETPEPPEAGISIKYKITSNPSDIKASFSHSTLKLPTLKPKLKQIELISQLKQADGKMLKNPPRVVVYKR